jgi:hypothetical protein
MNGKQCLNKTNFRISIICLEVVRLVRNSVCGIISGGFYFHQTVSRSCCFLCDFRLLQLIRVVISTHGRKKVVDLV